MIGNNATYGFSGNRYTSLPGIIIPNLNYDPSWTFDTSTRLYLCSDKSATNVISCNINSVRVWSAYYDTDLMINMLWGNVRKTLYKLRFSNHEYLARLVGDYRFSERSGPFSQDYAGVVGKVTFGSSLILYLS